MKDSIQQHPEIVNCQFRETEWEYACRAGTTTAYNTGSSITTEQANYGRSVGKSTEVGSYAANQWGLYDMHGNVYEWCWDWYGDYATGEQTDPLGAAPGSNLRVKRGGYWYFGDTYTRSANRGCSDPATRVYNIGFRVVRP
jgi:formylglycine-generating enzyme required for sulfatase activity